MARLWCGAGSVRVMRGVVWTEANETLQTRKQRHERVRENVEDNPQTRGRKGARRKRERMECRRRNWKSHMERAREVAGKNLKLEVSWRKKAGGTYPKEDAGGQRSENTRPRRKKTFSAAG